jgi:hypothetical protein
MNTQSRSPLVVPFITVVLALMVVAAIALLLGVGRTPAATTSSSAPPIALGSDAPSPSPSLALASSSPAPSASPSVTPSTPTTARDTRASSNAVIVAGLDSCHAVVAAIDDRGADHLAATCGNRGTQIRYSVSSDGRTWTTSVLQPPTSREELDPQLAFAGDTVYLAYTRVAPVDGGCGDNGLDDVGVYYRTRTLPNGVWSEPTRIGAVADRLQSFRVSGSVIHATVANDKDGKTAYETVTGGTLARYAIGDAAGWSSLRVGDDGKARVAYESTHGISYGMVSGDHFSSAVIPKSSGGWNPALALAPGNDAYLVWNRSYHGLGCVGPEPDPLDGTYFATNVSGSWVSSRLTKQVGGTSLTVDPASGELHVLVSDYRSIVYFHLATGADWVHETIARGSVSSPVIREDPTTDARFVAYVVDVESIDMETSDSHVEVILLR